MVMTADNIDLCAEWIGDRNAAYLAKENSVVWYTSLTGRKSDFCWHTLSVDQAVRVVRSMHQSQDTQDPVKASHLITAFQEAERVYEFGIKSNYPVKENVFNYHSEANMSMHDIICSHVATELSIRGMRALLLKDVVELTRDICDVIDPNITSSQIRDGLTKHLGLMSYEIRAGAYRPLYQGKKLVAVMLPSSKPKDIERLSKEVAKLIKRKIRGELL